MRDGKHCLLSAELMSTVRDRRAATHLRRNVKPLFSMETCPKPTLANRGSDAPSNGGCLWLLQNQPTSPDALRVCTGLERQTTTAFAVSVYTLTKQQYSQQTSSSENSELHQAAYSIDPCKLHRLTRTKTKCSIALDSHAVQGRKGVDVPGRFYVVCRRGSRCHFCNLSFHVLWVREWPGTGLLGRTHCTIHGHLIHLEN
jgi:hypothetical protein